MLKMEYVPKITMFWPKNDGEKWATKNIYEIPPCTKPFLVKSDLFHRKEDFCTNNFDLKKKILSKEFWHC